MTDRPFPEYEMCKFNMHYTNTVGEESREPDTSDNKTSDLLHKTDKKPSNEPFLGTTGLNIVIHNPESVVEVVSLVVGDDLVNAEKYNVSQKKNTEVVQYHI